MKIRKIFELKSIRKKISIFYFFLALINMAIFTILIYENQMELVTDNTKNKIENFTEDLIHSLNLISEDLMKQRTGRKQFLKHLGNEIARNEKIDSFAFFSEKGKVVYKSDKNIDITNSDITNGIKALTNSEFYGRQYYSVFSEGDYSISFYVPVSIQYLNGYIMFLKININDFDEIMNDIYILVSIVIAVIALFHFLFAAGFFRMFVNPIQGLHKTSVEIRNGNLTARATVAREDEIGDLGQAFNTMADSIQEKIEILQKYNATMEQELSVAGNVQKTIFPSLKNTESNDQFSYSIFFKSYNQVSGDYYDVFPLSKSRYGFLLVDVSGHGVPAALLTMMAKEKFRLYAPVIDDPADLFRIVNGEISQLLDEHHTAGFYFSAFYIILDKDRKISYCSAGHPYPVLVKTKQSKVKYLNTDGFLVGISADMNHLYKTKTITLDPDDKIILYTDGITEQANDEGVRFRVDGIINTLKKSFKKDGMFIKDSIIKELSEYADLDNLSDDATLIVIEIG